MSDRYDWLEDGGCLDSDDEHWGSEEELEPSRLTKKRIARMNSYEPQKAKRKRESALPDLFLLLLKIALVAAFVLVTMTFFFGLSQVCDTSMNPAIKEGDICLFYRPDTDYLAGDVVALEYNGDVQIRRVIAVSGDTVDITSDGQLVINGSVQIEDNIYEETYPYTGGITFPVTVGQNEIFVLGDGRSDAEDSRVYGCVSIKATKGTVVTVIRRRGI